MKYRVLFIDDDRMLTEAYRHIPMPETIEVVTAQTHLEAGTVLRTRQVDVVVCGAGMSDMSGTDFLVATRHSYPDTMRVMLTGYATLDSALAAINHAEVYRFLLKPCSFVELGRVVCAAAEMGARQREMRRLLPIVKKQAALLDGIEMLDPDALQRAAELSDLDLDNEMVTGEESFHRIRREVERFDARERRLQVGGAPVSSASSERR